MVGSGWRGAIIAVLCVLLGGCSAVRLAYNQGGEVAYWWLDGYFDFDDQQTPRVREAIGAWFAWHRRTQLPDYIELLQRAQKEVQGDTTSAQSCAWWDLARKRIDAGVEQALPALADVAMNMTPDQLAAFEQRQRKANDDFRDDFLQRDARRRLEAAVKRSVERAETIYGSIDADQRALLVRQTERSPFDAEAVLAEREKRQRETLQLLRTLSSNGGNRAAAVGALRSHAKTWFVSPQPAYRAYSDKLTAYVCDAAATLHNTTTPAQRQTGFAKFKGWEADLRALAAQ